MNKQDHPAAHREHAVYDEELGGYIFNSKYNFPVFEKAIIKHFKDGGLAHDAVIAGVCEVSQQTIMRWRQPNHEDFKYELDALINEYQPQASSVTDKWHRESARGDRRDANATLLNRRAEKLLGLGETITTVQKITHSYDTVEDYDEAIDKIKEEQDNQ